MTNEQFSTLLEYLDKLGAKLGVGVNEIWPWFIKQQYVDAFVSLGFFLITTIIATTCLLTTLKLWRKENKYNRNMYYYDDDGERIKRTEDQVCAYSIYHQGHELTWVWANVACLIILLGAGLIFYAQFFDIFNPEYSAFKDIAAQALQAKPK